MNHLNDVFLQEEKYVEKLAKFDAKNGFCDTIKGKELFKDKTYKPSIDTKSPQIEV